MALIAHYSSISPRLVVSGPVLTFLRFFLLILSLKNVQKNEKMISFAFDPLHSNPLTLPLPPAPQSPVHHVPFTLNHLHVIPYCHDLLSIILHLPHSPFPLLFLISACIAGPVRPSLFPVFDSGLLRCLVVAFRLPPPSPFPRR